VAEVFFFGSSLATRGAVGISFSAAKLFSQFGGGGILRRTIGFGWMQMDVSSGFRIPEGIYALNVLYRR